MDYETWKQEQIRKAMYEALLEIASNYDADDKELEEAFKWCNSR